MNDKEIDELIRQALNDESRPPEGLAERLDNKINEWDAAEKQRVLPRRRPFIYWISGVAAAIAIAVGAFFFVEKTVAPQNQQLADTYKDPRQAEIAASKALILLSENLNKGIDQMNDAEKNVKHVRHIVNEQLKAK